jgi:hypothetical protein
MIADKPWTKGPFELISHAATHMDGDSDFDRRMALISLDNAIEVSIRTFLHLHPQQRKGLRYKPDQIQAWKAGFHSLLEFLYDEHSKPFGRIIRRQRDSRVQLGLPCLPNAAPAHSSCNGRIASRAPLARTVLYLRMQTPASQLRFACPAAAS